MRDQSERKIDRDERKAPCRLLGSRARAGSVLKEVAGLLKEVKAMEEERIEERLLNVKEVAKILGCSSVTVSMRMTRGEIVWRLEKGSSTRKVAYSDLVDYMRELPTYTGALAPVLSKLKGEGRK